MLPVLHIIPSSAFWNQLRNQKLNAVAPSARQKNLSIRKLDLGSRWFSESVPFGLQDKERR